MRDIKIKIDAFSEAEDCDLIARLAITSQKRELFTQLASRFRQTVADLSRPWRAAQESRMNRSFECIG